MSHDSNDWVVWRHSGILCRPPEVLCLGHGTGMGNTVCFHLWVWHCPTHATPYPYPWVYGYWQLVRCLIIWCCWSLSTTPKPSTSTSMTTSMATTTTTSLTCKHEWRLLRNRGLVVMNELSWLFCKRTIYKHIYYFWVIAHCKLNKQMSGGIYLWWCAQPQLFLFSCANYSVGVTIFSSIDQHSTLSLDSYTISNYLIKLSCFGFSNNLVKMSAKVLSVAQYWSRILLETSFSHTKWCWMSMCLVQLWLIALLE